MSEIPDSKARCACDLDGVLTVGKGNTPVDFAPIRPGAQSFLRELHDRFEEVVIHTARNPELARAWMRANGLLKYVARVTNEKLPAKVYIDDRAVPFEGDFTAALAASKDFKTHWESGSKVGQEKKAYKFSTTQVDLSEPARGMVLKLAAEIPEVDLAEDGRETDPHITVLYGIEEDVPSEKLKKALRGFGRVTAKLTKVSLFENPDKDVIKLGVVSPDLHKLRKVLEANTKFQTDYPNYEPHATIGYVKSGKGKGAIEKMTANITAEFSSLVFSGRAGDKSAIPLL